MSFKRLQAYSPRRGTCSMSFSMCFPLLAKIEGTYGSTSKGTRYPPQGGRGRPRCIHTTSPRQTATRAMILWKVEFDTS
jgi:hypothetical protein